MGLDVSHDAWKGSYSAFDRFRSKLAEAAGVEWPHNLLEGLEITLPDGFESDNPGLLEFFTHSDCDGEIAPDVCALLANEMEALIPKLREIDTDDGGHIGHYGGYIKCAERWIAGCRQAAERKEPLEFY